MKIVWKDLPKQQGFFTRRSAVMLTLDTKKAIQFYSPNTKLNLSQYTVFNGSVYFRTEPAKVKNLNWAIKADSFDLPDGYLASLAPTEHSLSKKQVASHLPANRKTSPTKQKSIQKVAKSKSEGTKPQKPTLIKRLFGHFKKGK